MGIPIDRLFSARRLWLLLAAACFALVLASLVLTGVLRLHPCYLCVFQRPGWLVPGRFRRQSAGRHPGAMAGAHQAAWS
ncbi:MAG: disulfide bond formation protein B [Gallionellaceae bacterium]|nr:disulfide bond formation protein B [Gallionellaceae bacterium]MDD5365635.1 disulfide bond formation protein B [Gallionellaceae bacterium]